MQADLPPRGGDVRQDRGGRRRAPSSTASTPSPMARAVAPPQPAQRGAEGDADRHADGEIVHRNADADSNADADGYTHAHIGVAHWSSPGHVSNNNPPPPRRVPVGLPANGKTRLWGGFFD